MDDVQKRVSDMICSIMRAAVQYQLNLTIYEGKLGFVDQDAQKIVALWNPNHSLDDLKADENKQPIRRSDNE